MDYPKTMAEAESHATPNTPEHRREPKPDTRNKSKHWTTRRIKAKFVQFVTQYDPRTYERSRLVELSDVEMDGLPFTLRWTVTCPKSLAKLCAQQGVVIEFTAEFSETAHEARRAGYPLLRPPFRPVETHEGRSA